MGQYLVAKMFSPNGVQIGRRLVPAGWTLAYGRHPTDYVAAQDEARKARRGMWRCTFVRPWERLVTAPPRSTRGPVGDER